MPCSFIPQCKELVVYCRAAPQQQPLYVCLVCLYLCVQKRERDRAREESACAQGNEGKRAKGEGERERARAREREIMMD